MKTVQCDESQVKTIRPEVLAFAMLMESRLRQRDADNVVSLKGVDKSDLIECAASKCIRMEREQIDMRHPVDLANYCMMIAHVSGALESPVLERNTDNGGVGWVGLDQVQMS